MAFLTTFFVTFLATFLPAAFALLATFVFDFAFFFAAMPKPYFKNDSGILWHYGAGAPLQSKKAGKLMKLTGLSLEKPGAGHEARTRDLKLGKLALYQLS